LYVHVVALNRRDAANVVTARTNTEYSQPRLELLFSVAQDAIEVNSI
jgi:hypothetical protein